MKMKLKFFLQLTVKQERILMIFLIQILTIIQNLKYSLVVVLSLKLQIIQRKLEMEKE